MPKEEIDKRFNDFLWRMQGIDNVDAGMEMKLRIAYQEGVIAATEFLVKKFEGIKPPIKNN